MDVGFIIQKVDTISMISGVSALVKPKYAMLSENIRHWPLTNYKQI